MIPTFTEIAAKLVKLFNATDKYHNIVNGPSNATVTVESGVLPTFAKAIADFAGTVEGGAQFTDLDYAPLNNDQPGLVISGTLTSDGITEISPPLFLPENGENYYFDAATGVEVFSGGTANVDPWVLYFGNELVSWSSGSNQTLDTAVFTPDGSNTGTPTVAFLTRPKTTGQFARYDGRMYENRGDDTTPDWHIMPADELLLKLAGAQTVTGQKTFTQPIVSTGAPSAGTHVLNRDQADARYKQTTEVAITADVVTAPNSTTQTDIAGLVIPSVQPGSYIFESYLSISSSTFAATGTAGRLLFGGTVSSIRRDISYDSTAGEEIVNGTPTLNTGSGQLAILAYPGRSVAIYERGSMVVTVAGDLSLQMAQQTAGAGNLTARAGAYIRLTKVA